MIFWHAGATILGFRYMFRDQNVDLRFLVLGSVLPDLIDKPIGTVLFSDTLASGRIFGHTLLFAFVFLSTVTLVTRRGGPWRQRLLALAVGCLFHLVLDGMWTSKETFLWPAFGWEFPPGPPDYWRSLLGRLTSDPLLVGQELFGAGYLVYLWSKAGLNDPDRRSRLWTSGAITT